MKIPFDMQYDIGELLRETPKNATEFSKGIQFLKEQSQQSTEIEKARLLSTLGVYQRINGDLDASLKSLTEAKELISTDNLERLQPINDLRIAQTFQFMRRFEESEQQYLKLTNQIKSDKKLKDLLDFVYQHHGKLLFEQGKLPEAIICFEKALSLREYKNEQTLIDSTLYALEVAKTKLR